jgi:hypothetical protein
MKKVIMLLAIFAMTSVATLAAGYDASSSSNCGAEIYCKVITPLSCATQEANFDLPHIIGGTAMDLSASPVVVPFTIGGEKNRHMIVTLSGPTLNGGAHLGSFGGTVTLAGNWTNGLATIVSGDDVTLSNSGAAEIKYNVTGVNSTTGARGTYEFTLSLSAHYVGF